MVAGAKSAATGSGGEPSAFDDPGHAHGCQRLQKGLDVRFAAAGKLVGDLCGGGHTKVAQSAVHGGHLIRQRLRPGRLGSGRRDAEVHGSLNRQNDHDESWFALGALDPAKQPQVEDVATLLRHAGRVEVTDDIHSAKWMKLVVNAAELIPSAIVDTALNDAARLPGMLDLMRRAGYEAMDAALADGAKIMPIIGMPPVMSNHPERYVDEIFDEVLKTFSRDDTLTTSLQDWRKGRRAEIDEVNGWVVKMLAAHGKAAPVNDHVVRLACEIEQGRRTLTDQNRDDLLAIGPSR